MFNQIKLGMLIVLVTVLQGCNLTQNALSETTAPLSATKPNILLIQVDDLGYDDLSVHGNPILQTPNLDQLANESVRFNNFYVSSLCAPSRAALLTGRNFLRTGVSGVHGGRDYINLNETLFSDVLQNNGYTTGMWGKWHSGKTNGYFPWDRGFDQAYYASLYNYFDNVGLMNGQEVATKGFATNVITDFAIDFIDQKSQQDQPFLAYVSYMAPHNPWRAPAAFIDKYRDKNLSDPMATLYGMIDNLDHNIGRLLAALDKQNIADNTIVLFVSDNGPWTRSYRFGLTDEEWAQRNPNKRRGRKSDNWDNGIKSPLFVRWKGTYQPKMVDALTQIEDIFPSLLGWASIDGEQKLPLDGRSLLPLIEGQAPTAERAIYSAWASPLSPSSQHHPKDPTGFYKVLDSEYRTQFKYEDQRLAIRQGDYKYIRNEQGAGTFSLFNINQDPQEQRDLITAKPEIAAELNQQLKGWYTGILAAPHAHRMPQFQIGYNNRAFSQIYALAPSAHAASLLNVDHNLGGWRTTKDWATYDINVHTAGTYQAYLMVRSKTPEQLTFTLSDGKSSVTNRLAELPTREVGTLIRNESYYWENFDLPETFKKDIYNFELGEINLSKGEGQLTLALSSILRQQPTDTLNQVIAIQLVKKQ